MSTQRLVDAVPLLVVAGLVAAGLAHGPIHQPAGYHDFADQTVLFGIPHACDVLSNLPFAAVALWGLWRERRDGAAAGHGARRPRPPSVPFATPSAALQPSHPLPRAAPPRRPPRGMDGGRPDRRYYGSLKVVPACAELTPSQRETKK